MAQTGDGQYGIGGSKFLDVIFEPLGKVVRAGRLTEEERHAYAELARDIRAEAIAAGETRPWVITEIDGL